MSWQQQNARHVTFLPGFKQIWIFSTNVHEESKHQILRTSVRWKQAGGQTDAKKATGGGGEMLATMPMRLFTPLRQVRRGGIVPLILDFGVT
jgi:hypothetical protein